MKTLLKTFAGLVVVLIVAAVIVVFVGWSRVPDILANALSKRMKVSVEIEDLHLSSRSIEIDKIEIGNPKGSILPKAFSADTVLIQAPLSSYLHKDIVIDRIDISNVYVGLEFLQAGSSKGNWTTIVQNMKDSAGPEPESGKKRTVLIKKLVLTNVNIDLVYQRGGGKVQRLKPIKKIEFDNISSEGGFPTDQISRLIINQMLRSIFDKENLQNMLENLLDGSSQDGINKYIKPFRDLFNVLPEELENY